MTTPRRRSWLLGIHAVCGAVGMAWDPIGPAMLAIALATTAVVAWRVSAASARTRRFWRWYAVGFGLFAVAAVVYGAGDARSGAPLASTAGPLAAATLLAWAVALTHLVRAQRVTRGLATDATIAALVVGALLMPLVAPRLALSPLPVMRQLWLIAVPLLDLALLAVVVAWLSSVGIRTRAARWLLVMFVLLLVTDVTSLMLQLLDVFSRYQDLGLGWLLASAAGGLAATSPDAAAIHATDPGRGSAEVPLGRYVAALLLTAAVVVGTDSQVVHLAGMVLAAAVAALTMARVASLRAQVRALIVDRERGRWRQIYAHSHDVVYLLDETGHVVDVSPSVERRWHGRAQDVVGRHLLDFLPPEGQDAGAAYLEQIKALPDERESAATVAPAVDGRGRLRMVQVTGANLLRDPDVGGIVLTTRDVTEELELRRSLEDQAVRDPLTGLPNRELLADRLRRLLDRVAGGEVDAGLLFVDLDDFKEVNDALGHEIGDALLVEAARRLVEAVRARDTVARLGGDEFAVLLEDVDRDAQLAAAERVREALGATAEVAGAILRTGSSVGLANLREGLDASTALRHADLAMYEAKRLGKGRVAVYHERLEERARTRLEVRRDLAAAIADDRLTLHGQPILDLGTGRVTSVEMLLRWPCERGLVAPPSAFVPVAEETGLIHELGGWLLRRAIAATRAWPRAAADVAVAVNVSAVQLRAPGFAAAVARVLAEERFPAQRLIIELTESAFVGGPEFARRAIQPLRALGVRVAMDDFGTGWSSLHALSRLPLDVVKVDRAFTTQLPHDPSETTRQVFDLADSLGVPTVAEGVETHEELAALRRRGARLAQGYLLAPPAPAEELGPLLVAGVDVPALRLDAELAM